MNSYEMSRQYSQYKSKLAGLTEKKAPIQAVDTKKRRKITPQPSPMEEGIRKKRKFPPNLKKEIYLIKELFISCVVESITESGIVAPPDTSGFIQKMNASKSVITIDDDDEGQPPPVWNQPNSMKIEALISKRPDQP